MEFCAQEGVSAPSFYQWRRRLTPFVEREKVARSRNGKRRSQKSPAFASVSVVSSPPTSSKIRVPGGIEIELGGNVEIAETVLKQVLSAARLLAEACRGTP